MQHQPLIDIARKIGRFLSVDTGSTSASWVRYTLLKRLHALAEADRFLDGLLPTGQMPQNLIQAMIEHLPGRIADAQLSAGAIGSDGHTAYSLNATTVPRTRLLSVSLFNRQVPLVTRQELNRLIQDPFQNLDLQNPAAILESESSIRLYAGGTQAAIDVTWYLPAAWHDQGRCTTQNISGDNQRLNYYPNTIDPWVSDQWARGWLDIDTTIVSLGTSGVSGVDTVDFTLSGHSAGTYPFALFAYSAQLSDPAADALAAIAAAILLEEDEQFDAARAARTIGTELLSSLLPSLQTPDSRLRTES